MRWITFQEAIRRANISRRTGQNRIKDLKELDANLYTRIVKPGKPIMVLAPDIVAFFNTDIRRFKAKLRAVEKLKSGPKKYRKKEPVDPKMKAYI